MSRGAAVSVGRPKTGNKPQGRPAEFVMP